MTSDEKAEFTRAIAAVLIGRLDDPMKPSMQSAEAVMETAFHWATLFDQYGKGFKNHETFTLK